MRPTPTTAFATGPEVAIQGGLYFLNNTSDNVWVAVGYADGGGNWFSQGWVKIEPRESFVMLIE